MSGGSLGRAAGRSEDSSARQPTVSVVVPSYRDADLATSAIECVREQTYKSWELIIVDGSDAPTLRRVACDDERIRYRYRDPAGISDARNVGVEAADGEYVAFLDADDEWEPMKLERQMSAATRGADFVYTDIRIAMDGSTRVQSSLPVTDSEHHHIEFFREGGIPCSTVLVARELIANRRFDTELQTGEDRHMWIRLLRHASPARIDEPLALYRRRDGSLTDDPDQLYRDERRVIDDLTDRFPELRPYRETQISRAEYKLAKRLLRSGERTAEARRRLIGALCGGFYDPRVIALLAVSLAPVRRTELLRSLERVQESV